MDARELRALRADMLESAKVLVDKAEQENRDFTPEEQVTYNDAMAQADSLLKRAERAESFSSLTGKLQAIVDTRHAPAYNKTQLGDSEERSISYWARTGDMGAVASLRNQDKESGNEILVHLPRFETRAVDSTMNATTDADGKYAIPTGFAGQIAARRNEVRLAERLGVRQVPGKGTTVNFPFQNADPVVFATTSEQADNHTTNVYERDAMVLGIKAFTLVKKTKKVDLTEELLTDEDANIMGFVTDSIGRSIGITHNAALLTEVAASGTSFATSASSSGWLAADPEKIVYSDTLSYYLDDGGAISWVMRPSTFGQIVAVSAEEHIYSETPGGSRNGRTLLGYPVLYSNQAAALGSGAKSVYFGNWYYVGMREDPALSIIRDPYSVDGIVVLKYSFRLVYGVLVAGAIGYGTQAA